MTYEQFEKAAKEAKLYDSFSEADLELARRNPESGMSILNYKKDYINATTDEARALANAGANKIRAEGGGYYGGIDGSEKITQNSVPTLTGNYLTDTMNTKVNDLLKKDPFSYNPENDQLYSSYRKQYTREGKRATEDAIGTAAAMSGGVPSTYAATAGAQAGNYYASQMADKVPELYQIAYNKYMNDIENERANINMLSALEQAEQTKKDNEYNKKWSEAITAGQYGDFEALKALGVNPSDEYLASLYKTSEGTDVGADPGNENTVVVEKASELLEDALANKGVVDNEYDYSLLVAAYGKEYIEGLGITVKENKVIDEDFKPSSYMEAAEYIRDLGYEPTQVLKAAEWRQEKLAGGVGSEFNTYQEYLEDVVKYYASGYAG